MELTWCLFCWERTMNRLKKLRFEKDLSQYELALYAKVHQCRISLFENELAQPREDEKLRLASALNVSLDALFPAKDESP